MQKNVLEYLEQSSTRFPDKIAFADEHIELSFMEFSERCQRIGSSLLDKNITKQPIIVYMKKSPYLLTAFFGVVYSGCFYVPIDEEMPKRRMELILENTKAKYMICDEGTIDKSSDFGFKGECLLYEECVKSSINNESLKSVREKALDIDPVHIFYTSGSTGIPKGVVGNHRGIIDYIDNLSDAIGYDTNCIFANQTPLYWDASMKEIYQTLKHGATTYLVPKEYFMFPLKIIEFLNTYKINTINWVVSALTMISAFGAFNKMKPEYLKIVTFCGEVFPVKQFNIWKENLPDVEFYNLYGPTEGTGVTTYFHADRLFKENESIPIGKTFNNIEIILIKEDNTLASAGEIGELCIRGTGVTMGYFGDMKRTNKVFTQNPTHNDYIDIIYHTGDLAKIDEAGNYVFMSRKDDQIKHMGHRIELGEIEADVNLVNGINECCCLFVKEKNKIVLFYSGDIDKKSLTISLKERLPRYMIPNSIQQLNELPKTLNGKKDKVAMKNMYLKI